MYTQLVYPPVLKNLFIPSFLLCWPARQAVGVALVQLAQRHVRTRANIPLRAKIINLFIFLFCFIFTW